MLLFLPIELQMEFVFRGCKSKSLFNKKLKMKKTLYLRIPHCLEITGEPCNCHMYYLQDLFIINQILQKRKIEFYLTRHVNATATSKICADDERKNLLGPNDHAFIIISRTK